MKSVFNEKRYLNGDEEALECINGLRKEHLEKVEEDSEIYSKTIIKYDLFLEEVIDEILKYNLKNPLEYSIALNYLLDYGYLSDNCAFKHKESDREITGKLGANVVLGRGCCRNISDFHRDVFDKLGIVIQPFYCFQGLGRGTNREANHVLNLLEYKDNLYAIDLHNNSVIYHFKKPFIMESISVFNKDRLTYKPYYGLILGETDLETIKANIKRFEECSKQRSISPLEYYDDIKHKTKELMKSNRDSFEKFNESTKVLKKEIAAGMPK